MRFKFRYYDIKIYMFGYILRGDVGDKEGGIECRLDIIV